MPFQRISSVSLITCILALIEPGTGLSNSSAGMEFFRERVEIEVSESGPGGYDIHVRGFYYFRNTTPSTVERKLFYPFPDYEGASYPEAIRVSCYSDLMQGEAVVLKELRRGITFPITIAPSSTQLIRVDYTQHSEVGRGVYITTTTSAWKKPLERAEFVVSLPNSLCLTELSYPVERIRRGDTGITVDIRYDDFMPDEDLVIRWRPDDGIRDLKTK